MIESGPATVEGFVIPEERGVTIGEIVREKGPVKHGFGEDDRFWDTKYSSNFIRVIDGNEGGLDV